MEQMRFDSPRRLTFVRADEVTEGDILMEPINAFGTVGRTVHREEGRVDGIAFVGQERDVQLSWRTPYGEHRHERVRPYRSVVVIRTEDWDRK